MHKKRVYIIFSILFSLVLLFIIYNKLFISKNDNIDILENENKLIEDKFKEEDEQIIINEEIKDILLKYKDFNELVINANIKLPLNNNFIPQGITYYDNYLLVVGYYENGMESKCYVIDLKGNIINEVILDTNSHVGGIAFDHINDLIWIPDNNGVLNAYKAYEFLLTSKIKHIYQFNNISDGLYDYIDSSKKNIAFITIDDDYLYIGNFYKNKKCLTKKYLINNENDLKLSLIDKFYLPPKTQGISFYNYNDEKYLLISNSYNRTSTSYLELYLFNENIKEYFNNYIKKIEMPPMSEQVVVHENKAYIIFESGASKYYNSIDKIEYICMFNLKKLF